MDRLKTFGKYALMIIGMYLFTSFLIFVNFNINYKDITTNNDLPDQITIAKAEARKTEGRIYGYVKNERDNNVNGKYIKVEIFNLNNERLYLQYLRIDDVSYDEQKMFKVFFNVDNAKLYNISLVESESE